MPQSSWVHTDTDKTYCLTAHGFIQILVKLKASELMGSYRYWSNLMPQSSWVHTDTDKTYCLTAHELPGIKFYQYLYEPMRSEANW
jgi:hypothetical protein